MANYILDGADHSSAQTNGGFVDKKMLRAGDTLTPTALAIGDNTATGTDYHFLTETNWPNNDDWEIGTITVEVHIATANSSVDLDVRAERWNSANTLSLEASSQAGAQNIGTTGAYTFTIPSWNPAAGNCGDLLKIIITATRVAGHGNQSVDANVGENGGAGTNDVLTSITENSGSCAGAALLEIVPNTEQITEAIFTLLNYKRISGDSEQVSEQVLSFLQSSLKAQLGDNENISESILTLIDMVRFSADTENVTETTLSILNFVRQLDDTQQIQEGIIAIANFLRFVNENEQVSETVLAMLGRTRITDEVVQTSEQILSFLNSSFLLLVNESSSITEFIEVIINFTRIVNNIEQVEENILPLLSMVREVSSTEQITEDVIPILVVGGVALLAQSNNTINITESFITKLASALSSQIDQSVNITESILTRFGFININNDTIEVSDTLLKVMSYSRVINNSTEILEQINTKLDYIRLTTESVDISDSSLIVLALVRTLNESVGISDSVLSFIELSTNFINIVLDTEEVSEQVGIILIHAPNKVSVKIIGPDSVGAKVSDRYTNINIDSKNFNVKLK